MGHAAPVSKCLVRAFTWVYPRDVPKSMALGPGKNCPKFFNKRGEFRHKCRLQPCQLSAVFLHNYGLPEPEAEELPRPAMHRHNAVMGGNMQPAWGNPPNAALTPT